MLYMSLVLSLLYWLSSPPLSALTTLPMPLKAKTKKYRLSAVSHTILIVAILFALSAHINHLTYCPIQLNCECDAYRFAFRIKWYATTKCRSSYPYFFLFYSEIYPSCGRTAPMDEVALECIWLRCWTWVWMREYGRIRKYWMALGSCKRGSKYSLDTRLVNLVILFYIFFSFLLLYIFFIIIFLYIYIFLYIFKNFVYYFSFIIFFGVWGVWVD